MQPNARKMQYQKIRTSTFDDPLPEQPAYLLTDQLVGIPKETQENPDADAEQKSMPE